jgi:hypothetical protein
VDDPTETATTDPGATATPTHRAPTATPRATATPCVATGQSVHWRNRIVSANTVTSAFVLAVGCAHPTITVNTSTAWPGSAKSVSDLKQTYIGRTADVLATRQGDGTYLASSVNAPVSSGD